MPRRKGSLNKVKLSDDKKALVELNKKRVAKYVTNHFDDMTDSLSQLKIDGKHSEHLKYFFSMLEFFMPRIQRKEYEGEVTNPFKGLEVTIVKNEGTANTLVQAGTQSDTGIRGDVPLAEEVRSESGGNEVGEDLRSVSGDDSSGSSGGESGV
jgi:hypothetical protein